MEIISHIKKKLTPATVTLDGRDGTVTISEKVYDGLMRLGIEQNNSIYMFRVGDTFGFTVWKSEEKTHTYELQFNSKTKTVGFAPTCPTVAAILYEFGLPHDTVKRFRVTKGKAGDCKYFKLSRR